MKLILFLLIFSTFPKVTIASIEDFGEKIEGTWHGKGFNVYLGEYSADFTTKSSSKPNLLRGSLHIKSKHDPLRNIFMSIVIKKLSHNIANAYFVNINQEQPAKIVITMPLVESGNGVIAWRFISNTEKNQSGSGLKISINKEKELIFSFLTTQVFCDIENDFCISDQYSPFFLKKISESIEE